MLGSLHGALERVGLDAVEEAAVDAAADSLLALMDVDGKGHVALDDYRRIVRDHPEELRRRRPRREDARRRRSTPPPPPARRAAPRLAHLGGGAGARRAPQALALRRLRHAIAPPSPLATRAGSSSCCS